MSRLIIALALCVSVALAANWTDSFGKKVTGSLNEKPGGWKACDSSVNQWAGYYDINATTNKHYWYWAFGPRSGRVDAPVILWMTGGPGCSSSLAMLAENGPCHMNETTGALYNNPYAWNKDAYVVYIDQPAGVGYSYSDSNGVDSNEKEVAHDMFWFIQDLFKAHGWLSQELFVFGESYGGHFAPATAHRVWLGNQNKEGSPINLAGLAIGNGLVDPVIQYQYYAELAYTWCKEKLGTPCVSETTYNSMVSSIPSCLKFIESCHANNTFACMLARMTCNGNELAPYQQTGRNVYDIRKECTHEPLCYDFSKANSFMNRADVQDALNVKGPVTWQSCNMDVNQGFGVDWFQEFATQIPALLASDIRVMVYAGDVDFICNWLGNKAWTKKLVWPGQATFLNAADLPMNVDGTPGATVRSVSSAKSPIQFSFVQVHDAGHMVPMDQPQTALTMITKFLLNKNFTATD